MPNTKEKLIEALSKSIPYGYGTLCLIADELMANGVTLDNQVASSKWISVKDRLPIEEVKKYRGKTGEDPEFNVMIKGGLVPTSLFFNGEYWYCNFDYSYAVTHWAPMPQPPEGE